MMNAELIDLLQQQVNVELAAAQTYQQLGLLLEYASWEGAAAFFYAQAEEEREHAMSFARLLMDRGVEPRLTTIMEISDDLRTSDIHKAFRVALELEQNNRQCIETIARKVRDKDAFDLQDPIGHLLADQQKEVAEFESKIDVLERIDGDNGALVAFDQRLKT